MDLDTIMYCPRCNRKYFSTTVFRLSCMHSFCERCILETKNEITTICSICEISTNNIDIIRNKFIERLVYKYIWVDILKGYFRKCDICDEDIKKCVAEYYCYECINFMCKKCLKIHDKFKENINHHIADKNAIDINVFKGRDQKCEKHEQDLKVYCKECDQMICTVCSVMGHENHNKDDNIQEIIEESKMELLRKVDEINQIISSQNNIRLETDEFQRLFIEKVKKIEDQIKCQSNKLKELIENKSNELINKLVDIKETFIGDCNKNFTEIHEYISSLNKSKLYIKSAIDVGTNYDLLKITKEVIQTKWIKLIEPKKILLEHITLTSPSFDVTSLQSKTLFGLIQSIKIDGTIKKNKYETLSTVKLIFTINKNLYICNYPLIHIYDMHFWKFKTSINLETYITENYVYNEIIGASNYFFISLLRAKESNISNECIIYKYELNSKACIKWKTMDICSLSSTNQNTILASTNKNEMIEFSLDGIKLKIIKPSYISCLQPPFHNSLQLNDGRYVVWQINKETVISLLNSDGSFIKSLNRKLFCLNTSESISLCTDGDKYLFINYKPKNVIIVMSTELQEIQEVKIIGVENISYDRLNCRLLVDTFDEIFYFKYNTENLKFT